MIVSVIYGRLCLQCLGGGVGGAVVGGGAVVASLQSPSMFPLSSQIIGSTPDVTSGQPTGTLHSPPVWFSVNC